MITDKLKKELGECAPPEAFMEHAKQYGLVTERTERNYEINQDFNYRLRNTNKKQTQILEDLAADYGMSASQIYRIICI